MLINTASLLILRFAVHLTITLIIVMFMFEKYVKSLLTNLIIIQGPASEAYETLRFMYIFTPISRSNVCKICNIKCYSITYEL
jgi:hypothetical protein